MKILYNWLWKCHNLIFYVTGKVENFHGMNCFFLHCLPISYFIIHVCNQIIDKHSEMTKSWNFQTSPYQKLKSNFSFKSHTNFFRTNVLHQDKKRWKQVKHHWFDIIQPIRPHLRWKFFTISCENVTILFSMWHNRMFKIFMEWTVYSFIAILFLILLYMFAIKKSINILKWPNPEIFKLHHIRGWSQILEFYISYQFCSTDVLHQDKKRLKQVKHHWFDIVEPIRPHLRWKFFTIGSKYVTILFSMWQLKLNIFMEWTVFSFIAMLFLILLYMFAIKKSINTLKWPNPEIFKLHHIRGWSQILEFHISYQFS